MPGVALAGLIEGRGGRARHLAADRAGGIGGACARYEARLRPWVEAAQRMARRNVRLFTPANRFQLLPREAVMRLAAWSAITVLIKRLLNREGERL